ncbi:hypothetical protein CMV_011331 [Castanea mollissima]|uniref:Uncharacterized protein n=1 Tax=Castanea mollissima TaxID=60419 RepID=A0A8J4R3K8_9ROSI|nr:hypothetical protein CMV_011331 [Castanea mollissima]
MERREKQRIERAETAERRERQRNYTDEDDIGISNLSDCLLCLILSFLPIWDAIVKSILSSRQRPLWTLVPYNSSDDVGERSMTLQVSLANNYTASVDSVIWNPNGALFGFAYSKHIVQIYSYQGIDAHVSMVSDIAFSHSSRELCIITSGEDKTIKGWDAVTGNKLYTFVGY